MTTRISTQLFEVTIEELMEGHLALDRLGCPREIQDGDNVRECLIAERIAHLPSNAQAELTAEQVYLINDMIHAWIEPEKKGEFRQAFRNDCKRLLATGGVAQAARVPKVRTSHHRNKEGAARLQELVAERYAPAQAELSYAKGVADANEMVGALWSDLFNKDMVNRGADQFFDKWRDRIKALSLSSMPCEPAQVPASPTGEDIYACCRSTLIGFRDELTEQQIKFICDQISRKSTLPSTERK